nr:unnamed protein product [Callosobruchus analis]
MGCQHHCLCGAARSRRRSRRRSRPGGDPAATPSAGILSPRGSDNGGGLGVKMVEYVLGTSPTGKEGSAAAAAAALLV